MADYENGGLIDDDDDLDTGKKGKKKNKAMTALIAIFIIVIWIAIFALLIKLDVGGFGSSVLYPVLKDVPVLNKILPDVDDRTLSSNSGETYSTLQQAIDRINELENEIAIYKKNSDENAEKISNLTAEVSRLKTYEENQVYFETLKKKFDREVVYTDKAPDINEYKTWYEEMYPENADEIYRQVLEQLAMDQVITDLATAYASMKPSSAARIFEGMTGDLEKVARILSSMKESQAGAILQAMDPTLAAKLTLLIYPRDIMPKGGE